MALGQGIDNFPPKVYTEYRNEGATGKRLAPFQVTRSNRWLGRPGGYFFLFACMNRAIMATTKMPV